MLEAHIHEQHSATHDAAIVALLLAIGGSCPSRPLSGIARTIWRARRCWLVRLVRRRLRGVRFDSRVGAKTVPHTALTVSHSRPATLFINLSYCLRIVLSPMLSVRLYVIASKTFHSPTSNVRDNFSNLEESNLTPAQPPANESNEPTSSRAPDSARDSRQRARWARSSNRQ
ncbi:hypothetical protein SFRURICE_015200 [Spodoptera frugiperda]|nr:hypothetical protein SFRURICE_015200 [Spodoptera frugiperda]